MQQIDDLSALEIKDPKCVETFCIVTLGDKPENATVNLKGPILINSQNKWLKRIEVFPENPEMDWWKPEYSLDELESKWDESLNAWIHYLENKTEDELNEQMKFAGYDGGHWSAALKDIALQLNYHSIHHRAQIQTIIRQQGLQPDFVDYIGTKYTKLS